MSATQVSNAMFFLTLLSCLVENLCAQSTSEANRPIPANVILEARNRQIPLDAIKLRGQQWVACFAEGSQGERCIVLGESRLRTPEIGTNKIRERRLTRLRFGDRLIIDRFGFPRMECTLSSNLLQPGGPTAISELGVLSLEKDSSLTFALASSREAKVTVVGRSDSQTIDALPRYKREGPQVVRTSDVQLVSEYMDQHKQEPFMVIITVPSQCEPCQRYEPIVAKALEAGHANSISIKTFVLEYFSFEDAKRDALGTGAIFPTTLIFAPRDAKASTPSLAVPKLVMGSQYALFQGDMKQKIETSFGRGAPHAMANGMLSMQSLKLLVSSLEN